MDSPIKVRSVQVLRDLKGAVERFDQESIAALRAAEQELQATERWLQERLSYWRTEVLRWEEAVRLAGTALQICQNSASYDPRTGASYVPNCSAQQAALAQAQAKVLEAQRQRSNVQTWQDIVRQAATAYRDQVIQVTRMLPTVLPSARNFLGNKVTELETYAAAGAFSDARISSGTAAPHPTAGVQSPTPASSGTWSTPEIQMVTLDQIDVSTSSVTGLQDFHKVSPQDMMEGFQKLQQVVMPAVAQGADGDYFAQLDTAQGLAFAHGYQRIFEGFYGNDAIRLEKLGATYHITNGEHRLFLARQLGLKAIPAFVTTRQA